MCHPTTSVCVVVQILPMWFEVLIGARRHEYSRASMVVAVQQLLLLVVVWLAGLTDGGPGETEGLLEWIRELGGGVEGVGFQSIPGMGMGVVSTRNLEVGVHCNTWHFSV